jgi:hypothetical protein
MASNNVNANVPSTCSSLSALSLTSPETPQKQYPDLATTLVDKSSSDPNAVSDKDILFKVPLELREKIYTEIFLEESSSGIVDGTDSLALEAFQLNSKLYKEALWIYWKVNTLLLDRNTLPNFKYRFPESHLSYVENPRLEIE